VHQGAYKLLVELTGQGKGRKPAGKKKPKLPVAATCLNRYQLMKRQPRNNKDLIKVALASASTLIGNTRWTLEPRRR